jgi:hypothetical protein
MIFSVLFFQAAQGELEIVGAAFSAPFCSDFFSHTGPFFFFAGEAVQFVYGQFG